MGAPRSPVLIASIAAMLVVAAEFPPPLIERTVSELVLIEAYVTDAHGQPLHGLTQDDFILIIDGHKCPIASFELHESGPIKGEAVAPAQPVRAAGLPRRFMLFFEDGTSAPNGLTAARQAAHRFLSSGLLPSDQVGLATYDTGLRILHDFTTDRESLRRAIDQSLHESRRISDFVTEQMRHEEEIDRLMPKGNSSGGSSGFPIPGDPVDKAKSLAMAFGREEASHLRHVLRAVGTLVDALGGWRGYKAIVYMGDGLPENPALPYAERILASVKDNHLLLRVSSVSLSSDFQALIQSAAASGVTIHSLQTRGLEAGDARQLKAGWRRTNFLRSIALDTGGLASTSNDFLKALNDFETSSRSFYVLGYQPQDMPDGRMHSVQVKCRSRDARVRWRKEFIRLKPPEARERAILAAYTVPEMYEEMGVGLSAVAGPMVRSGRIADVVVHVPGNRIAYLPEKGRPTAHLEVGLVAVDEARKETARASRNLSVSLRPEHGQPGTIGIDLVHRVRLPAGSQTIIAVVSDGVGGMIGGARLSLPASASTEGSVLGLSIYSLSERSLWIDLPEGDAGAATPAPDSKPTIGPALKAVYWQGEPVVCGFRMPEGLGASGAELRMAISQGEAIVETIAIEPRRSGAGETVHVPLPVDAFPPGDYTVEVQEMLPTGAVGRGRVPLAIRPVAGP